MPKIGPIRGMLLEEALLHLLRGSGYRTVEDERGDETLQRGPAGLMVKGRGSNHQIDAIADFMVHQPFSHSQRLLVEAKCYSTNVRLPVVRNAVGVLKDVSEYWVPGSANVPAKKRYHYQYALFSASSYTREAQKYAFAQDIYLIPLANSVFFRPVVDAIYGFSEADLGVVPDGNIGIHMGHLRHLIRHRLRDSSPEDDYLFDSHDSVESKLPALVTACQRIDCALIATLGGSFPVFLVPGDDVNVDALSPYVKVRIFWDSTGWYLEDDLRRRLFSFDLPTELFDLYAEGGILSRRRALDLKEEVLSEFQGITTRRGEVKVITFGLDHEWLEYVRSTIHETRSEERDEE